jgi:hypothetical protein
VTGENEPWTKDGWAPGCKCGVCHTCLPVARETDPLIAMLPARGEN